MSRIARMIALAAVGTTVSGVLLAVPSGAASAGPVAVTPVTGTSATTSTFETAMVCKASDNVSVVVFGGSGAGATIAAGTPKTMVPSTPVASVTKDGGMNIPATQTWAQFAQNIGNGAALTVLNGEYTVEVKCENGETFSGKVEFTGTAIDGATYRLVAPTPTPSPTTATATATETKTSTATATETKTSTATATKTTAVPEKPIPVPAQPPTPNNGLVVTGTVISGGGVTVSGGGFRPGSPVTVGAWPGAVNIGSAVAESNGKASTPVLIPKDAKGKYTVAMLGYGNDGKEVVLATTVDVISQPDIAIPEALPKSDGALTIKGSIVPGGTISVTGSGYKPGSPIAVGIYSTGKEIASAVAGADGTATTDVVIPTSYTGKHTLAMIGSSPSNTVRTLTSEVDLVAPSPTPAPEPASSGIPVWVWVLLALIVIAIIVIAIVMSRRKPSPWDTSLAGQAANAQRLATVTAPAIADRAKPANECIALWNVELPQMQAAELQVAQLAQAAPDDTRRANAQRLQGSAVALREALQVDVQLRADASVSEAQLAQSAAVVLQRQQELSAVVASLPHADGGAHR